MYRAVKLSENQFLVEHLAGDQWFFVCDQDGQPVIHENEAIATLAVNNLSGGNARDIANITPSSVPMYKPALA